MVNNLTYWSRLASPAEEGATQITTTEPIQDNVTGHQVLIDGWLFPPCEVRVCLKQDGCVLYLDRPLKRPHPENAHVLGDQGISHGRVGEMGRQGGWEEND